MGAFFDQHDATRTCPVCGHPLKAYDRPDGARLLACTGGKACTWVIAKGLIPLPVIRQMVTDREKGTRQRPDEISGAESANRREGCWDA